MFVEVFLMSLYNFGIRIFVNVAVGKFNYVKKSVAKVLLGIVANHFAGESPPTLEGNLYFQTDEELSNVF